MDKSKKKENESKKSLPLLSSLMTNSSQSQPRLTLSPTLSSIPESTTLLNTLPPLHLRRFASFYPLKIGGRLKELKVFESKEYTRIIDYRKLKFKLPNEKFKSLWWGDFASNVRKLANGEDLCDLASQAWNGLAVQVYTAKKTRSIGNGFGYIFHKCDSIFALESLNNERQFLFYQSDEKDTLIILGAWKDTKRYQTYLKLLSDAYRNGPITYQRYRDGGWLKEKPVKVPEWRANM